MLVTEDIAQLVAKEGGSPYGYEALELLEARELFNR